MRNGRRCRAGVEGSRDVWGGEKRGKQGPYTACREGWKCVRAVSERVCATKAGWLGFRLNVSALLNPRVTTARSSRPVHGRRVLLAGFPVSSSAMRAPLHIAPSTI